MLTSVFEFTRDFALVPFSESESSMNNPFALLAELETKRNESKSKSAQNAKVVHKAEVSEQVDEEIDATFKQQVRRKPKATGPKPAQPPVNQPRQPISREEKLKKRRPATVPQMDRCSLGMIACVFYLSFFLVPFRYCLLFF
jgi:hypothetical protein